MPSSKSQPNSGSGGARVVVVVVVGGSVVVVVVMGGIAEKLLLLIVDTYWIGKILFLIAPLSIERIKLNTSLVMMMRE